MRKVHLKLCLLLFMGLTGILAVIIMISIQDFKTVPQAYRQVTNLSTDFKTLVPYVYRQKEDFIDYLPTLLANKSTVSPTQDRSDSGQVKVILLTYMRSGSSFTGNLLQQHPDVFYVYEPLNTMQKYWQGQLESTVLSFLNETSRSIPVSEMDLSAEYIEIVRSYLNCELNKVDLQSLTQLHMVQSRDTKPFFRCVHGQLSEVESCLQPMREQCLKSRMKAVKVIRLSMTEAGMLMGSDPNVKVIHLVRDVRATLLSQFNLEQFKWLDVEQKVPDTCLRMEQDIRVSLHLSKQFPGRILTVRYEDIVESPVQAVKEMYEFLDLSWISTLDAYIWNITYAGLPDGCNICVVRSNATETAYKWRKTLNFGLVELIQRQCASIFHLLGYRVFSSPAEVEDERVPAKFEFYGTRI